MATKNATRLGLTPVNGQSGFTLIELSIVIMIMGLVLGGLAVPLAAQRENARLRDADAQLEMLSTALTGYALVNGSLPCPASPGSNGSSDTAGGACSLQHGFVPATTLGLSGNRNDDNLLLDPWGGALRYSVSNADVDTDGLWDFTTPGELRDVGIAQLLPDLAVCSTATGATGNACGSAATTLTSQAPAVVYSLGKDWPDFSSPDQVENVGGSVSGGPSGSSYRIATNSVFVARGKSEIAGSEFDDIVTWLSPVSLYQGLVTAGQLP